MTAHQIFRRLVRECLRFPGRLLGIVLSLAILGLAQLYLTWLVKLWAEGITAPGAAALMSSLLIRAALTSVVAILADFSFRYLLSSVNQRLMERLRNDIHANLLSRNITMARALPTGEWMARVFNDVGALATFMRDVVRRLIGEGIIIVGAIGMMFHLQWRLALAACLLVPPVALLIQHLGPAIRRHAAAAQKSAAELSATLSEHLSGLSTIKGFQTESFERQRFGSSNARARREVMRSEWWAAMLVTLVWLVTGFGLLGIFWYGTHLSLSGAMTVGDLLAFCIYAGQTVEPLRRISEVQGLLQRVLAAAERVYDVIDSASIETDGAVSLPVPVRGDLRLDGLHFRYRSEDPVLEGIDLRVAPGENVAVVAASGGGKSTLASLLARFVTPQRGRILLDGEDVGSLRLAELRRAVCIVEQNPFIFSGPLIDNIRYGSWQASPADIESAVSLTGMESMVASLPDGLNASLEEGGRDLSGGQKQRIALARAIVREPALLVLDEVTSALDSESEAQIFAQLDSWLRKRTVLAFSHRLSTISRFPRVIVLDRGRVVGDGSVSELLRTCPAFSQLFAEQLAPMGWSEGLDGRRAHVWANELGENRS